MNSSNIKNIAVFSLINCIAFSIQYGLSNQYNYLNQLHTISIPLSYIVNALLTLVICISIFFIHKILENQTGFIFLGFSVLKMIVLFIFLNPTNPLGHVSTIDALSLFIPFGLNLIMEQIFIVKLLKISDLANIIKK